MRLTTLLLALAGSLACGLCACAGDLTAEGLLGAGETDPDGYLLSSEEVRDPSDDAADPSGEPTRAWLDVSASWSHRDASERDLPDALDVGDDEMGSRPDVPECNVPSELYRTVNIEACDCAGCAERAATAFTLGVRSRVLQVMTYVRAGSPGAFGYSITAPDGTVIESGTMELVVCHATMPWCFFGVDIDVVLDPGTYGLAVDWPHICSNPSSGGQGFVIVNGCPGE